MENFLIVLISTILIFAQANVIEKHRPPTSVTMDINALAAAFALGNSGASQVSTLTVYGDGLTPASLSATTQSGSVEANEALISQETLTTEELAVATNEADIGQLGEASESVEFAAIGLMVDQSHLGWAETDGEGEGNVFGETEINVVP